MEENTKKPEIIGTVKQAEPISTIKGAINYTIKEFEGGGWEVEYESSTDNDLAAIAIAQDLTETIVSAVSLNKAQTTNKEARKHLNKIIEKGVSARTGLKAIADYLQPIYRAYKKSLAKEEDGNKEN